VAVAGGDKFMGAKPPNPGRDAPLITMKPLRTKLELIQVEIGASLRVCRWEELHEPR